MGLSTDQPKQIFICLSTVVSKGCDGYVYFGYTNALWALEFIDYGCQG